jgi:ribosomal protein S12 methylthiotransferase accessory factor
MLTGSRPDGGVTPPAPTGVVVRGWPAVWRDPIAAAVDRWSAGHGFPAGPAEWRGDAVVVAVTNSGTDAVQRADEAPEPVTLAVHHSGGAVFIGPVTRPGVRGCARCAALRRRAVTADPHHSAVLRSAGDPPPSVAVDLVARLVATDLAKLPGTGSFRRVDLRTLAVSRHRFLPDPGCERCGDVPADDPAAATIAVRPRPKLDPVTSRTRDVMAGAAQLLDTYVDPVAGVIRRLKTQPGATPPRAVAFLSSTRGHEAQQGWGRTATEPGARVTAVLEAMERLGGEAPGGRRTVTRGSFREVSAAAIDPRTFGLYPDERYDDPDLPFERYDDDLVLDWVWGYSFARGEPVLVPEQYAYYASHSAQRRRFVYEISNGCALGSNLEEAVLHGVLEVAERDAFLMTWYARMPVPRIDLDSARDRRVTTLTTYLRQTTGYDIALYSSMLEQRIPCVFAMAVGTAPGRPRVFCAGGSALVAENAALGALYELSHLLAQASVYNEDQRRRAAAMISDPGLVRSMGDHSLLYCHEDAFDRFGFLVSGSRRVTFADVADRTSWPPATDLTADLAELVGRYRDEGLDVVAVDQTTPEHRAGGLACVKVIIPGTLSMTFGHRNRRVDGVPRLLRVPHRLGYASRVLGPADINPHPHPFP